MVPTGKHVQEFFVGEGTSVLNAIKSMSQEQRAATLCIDQSTIGQSVSKAVALKLREAGVDLVDAPVSGGELKVSGPSSHDNEFTVSRCRGCREGHSGHHVRWI